MLPLTLFFNYRHDYSFSSGKKWLLSERFFHFLGRCIQRKIKQMFCQIFLYINFLIKPFLISNFNPQELLNELVDISQKKEPKTQKMSKSYLCINI